MRNIEMKARCPEPARIRRIAQALGATPHGALRQIDTYFHVPVGRLKLREMATAELIFYHRSDTEGPKASEYEVAPVGEPERMRTALAAALGIWITVEKSRDLWILENVRIHLDEVKGLGTFLELEAIVDAAHSEQDCHAMVRKLLADFGVLDDDLLGCSYSDLIAAKDPPGPRPGARPAR